MRDHIKSFAAGLAAIFIAGGGCYAVGFIVAHFSLNPNFEGLGMTMLLGMLSIFALAFAYFVTMAVGTLVREWF